MFGKEEGTRLGKLKKGKDRRREKVRESGIGKEKSPDGKRE